MVACTQSIFPSKILFKKPQIKDKKNRLQFLKGGNFITELGRGKLSNNEFLGYLLAFADNHHIINTFRQVGKVEH